MKIVKILRSKDNKEKTLEDDINAALADGWSLQGNMSVSVAIATYPDGNVSEIYEYVQMMIKDK